MSTSSQFTPLVAVCTLTLRKSLCGDVQIAEGVQTIRTHCRPNVYLKLNTTQNCVNQTTLNKMTTAAFYHMVLLTALSVLFFFVCFVQKPFTLKCVLDESITCRPVTDETKQQQVDDGEEDGDATLPLIQLATHFLLNTYLKTAKSFRYVINIGLKAENLYLLIQRFFFYLLGLIITFLRKPKGCQCHDWC